MDIVLQLLLRFSRNRKTSRLKWWIMRSWNKCSSVRNIPKFENSCDVMELYCSRGKWRIDYVNDHIHRFEALRHIFKTFYEAYTIVLSGPRIESHIGSVSWNIQHTLWLISSFIFYTRRCIGKILVGFQGRWTSIYYFFDSQIFFTKF